MDKRIFIAINLPSFIKKEIQSLQLKLSHFDWPIRWEPIDNFHITLRFLGKISNIQIAKIIKITEEIGRSQEVFKLSVNNYIFYPNLILPKIIALEIIDNHSIIKLQNNLSDQVDKLGIGEQERHDFSAHITIGRMKPTAGNYRALTKLKYSAQFEVKAIDVMESILTATGADYNIIKTIKLK